MESKPIWSDFAPAGKFETLLNDISTEVVIIGAGITGVTAALNFINQGKKVTIIEAKSVGGYTTSHSTGNLYIAVQPYYQNIYKKFNEQVTAQIAHSRKFAIDFIESTIKNLQINCGFHRRPWFLYTNDKKRFDFLEKEVEIFQKINIPIKYIDSIPLPLTCKKAAVMPDQARINPYQYIQELAQYLHRQGCLIYENTRAIEVKETKTGCEIKTAQAKIHCQQVMIATHTPIGINPLQFFVAPYRSYVVASQQDSLPECHTWDLDDPHHSICTHPLGSEQANVLMLAGSHHKTGQESNTSRHFSILQNFLKKELGITSHFYQWSAQHFKAADDVPYIGLAHRGAKNVYTATGYFADGLVYGTLAGILLADLMLGKENALNSIYTTKRFNLKSAGAKLIKENTNVFLQYLKDYTLLFKKTDYKDLKPGEGKVVQIDQEKWAVCRDKNNQLHRVSAICTHMKCMVHWNNSEQSWDCPCHGSRFSKEGEVLEGPATMPLKKGSI